MGIRIPELVGFEWTSLVESEHSITEAACVPGGLLIQTKIIDKAGYESAVSIVFVPEVKNHE